MTRKLKWKSRAFARLRLLTNPPFQQWEYLFRYPCCECKFACLCSHPPPAHFLLLRPIFPPWQLPKPLHFANCLHLCRNFRHRFRLYYWQQEGHLWRGSFRTLLWGFVHHVIRFALFAAYKQDNIYSFVFCVRNSFNNIERSIYSFWIDNGRRTFLLTVLLYVYLLDYSSLSVFNIFCIDIFAALCYTVIERGFTVNNCQTLIQLGIHLR